MGTSVEICALNLKDHDNLDAEMSVLVKGIEKKYGFMPHFVPTCASMASDERTALNESVPLRVSGTGRDARAGLAAILPRAVPANLRIATCRP